jgi:hypothetical protein
MDCNRFWVIITLFLAWIGQQLNFQIKDANQQLIPLVPATYGKYTESLIQYVINHNEAGAGAATAAGLLRGNLAQYTELAAGAKATQFFDINGNILFDINPAEATIKFPEESTLWGELKGLWETINLSFGAANPVGKMLALMQMIGIIKCAKWCITTTCDMVSGAINLGKWSYNMLANLVINVLNIPAPSDQSQIIPNQRFKNAVNKVIIQNTIISFWLKSVAQGQVVDTLNDILIQIDTNTEIKNSPTEPMETILLRQYQQQQHQQQQQGPFLSATEKWNLLTPEQRSVATEQQNQNNANYAANGTNTNGFSPTWGNRRGGSRTKRRPYKSKRRRTKSRSSKKRRRHKTKKRVYRSTRFRTHR